MPKSATTSSAGCFVIPEFRGSAREWLTNALSGSRAAESTGVMTNTEMPTVWR